MPYITEYLSQQFKMKIVVFVNRRFFEKCLSPAIYEVNKLSNKIIHVLQENKTILNSCSMKFRIKKGLRLKEKFLPKEIRCT